MLQLNKIYNIDCLEGIKKIDDNSIDLIVTDPPYCVGTTSNGHKGDWTDNNMIQPFFDIFFRECERVLKDDTEIYVNTDWRTYPFLYPLFKKYFTMRNLIVWDYEWIKAGNYYRFSYELVMYGTKGKPKRRYSGGDRDVWRIRPINYTSKDKLHQAQKPVELIEKMILNSSVEGDTVLDPFVGSGTTAEACIKNNRNYLCFEIKEQYHKVSEDRAERVKQALTM